MRTLWRELNRELDKRTFSKDSEEKNKGHQYKILDYKETGSKFYSELLTFLGVLINILKSKAKPEEIDKKAKKLFSMDARFLKIIHAQQFAKKLKNAIEKGGRKGKRFKAILTTYLEKKDIFMNEKFTSPEKKDFVTQLDQLLNETNRNPPSPNAAISFQLDWVNILRSLLVTSFFL
jgi:hypothetical protein